MEFFGTRDYIADKDLTIAVNAAIRLERPLLVKGEPGTGKTELARQVAASLGLDMIEWSIKSTTKAQEGLYVYDTVQRLYDSQFGEGDVAGAAVRVAGPASVGVERGDLVCVTVSRPVGGPLGGLGWQARARACAYAEPGTS